MIKTGSTIQEIIDEANKELENKVSKEQKIAGIKLSENLTAEELSQKLFSFSETFAAPIYDKNGNRIDPTPEEIDKVTPYAEAVSITHDIDFTTPDPFEGEDR